MKQQKHFYSFFFTLLLLLYPFLFIAIILITDSLSICFQSSYNAFVSARNDVALDVSRDDDDGDGADDYLVDDDGVDDDDDDDAIVGWPCCRPLSPENFMRCLL